MAQGDITAKEGTQIRFAVAGSLSPADAGTNLTVGTPTDITITLSGVADGAGRQSDKGDLGANRPRAYAVSASFDWTGETPTVGERVDLYWAPSGVSTQANGNVFGNSGADEACPDGAVGSPTLAEFLLLCDFIGSFATTDDAGVQTGLVNPEWSSPTRYGQLVVVNESGDMFEEDNVEAHVVFDPILENAEP